MSIFKLPDLGEGLPDAEIHEWHVKEGDNVTVDQPLVSMETAKAVVDVPSPQTGTIKKLHGKPGDIIKTGHPLVEFVSDSSTKKADTGTVVGNLATAEDTVADTAIIGRQRHTQTNNIQATAAVRRLARDLNVDLTALTGTGPHGLITQEDVKHVAHGGETHALAKGFEPLHGVRRAMVHSMTQSHREIVPVTLVDDADIHAWPEKTDITARVIQAIVAACKAEPALNAWFDGKNTARCLQSHIHLGLAMDTEDGLFVPVIKNAEQKTAQQLRDDINRFKTLVKSREIPPEDLQQATLTLSNFGTFAGRYANPIIVPPTVAIIGTGRLREEVVAANGKPAAHRIMPLSLTFDHRAVTGGEASRFLGVLIEHLALHKEA